MLNRTTYTQEQAKFDSSSEPEYNPYRECLCGTMIHEDEICDICADESDLETKLFLQGLSNDN